MADNTNPEAIRFCNERVRPLADALAQVYHLARAVRAEWYANNLGALLPSADTVMDGSAQDGRHPITGNDAAVAGLAVGFHQVDASGFGTVREVALSPAVLAPVTRREQIPAARLATMSPAWAPEA